MQPMLRSEEYRKLRERVKRFSETNRVLVEQIITVLDSTDPTKSAPNNEIQKDADH